MYWTVNSTEDAELIFLSVPIARKKEPFIFVANKLNVEMKHLKEERLQYMDIIQKNQCKLTGEQKLINTERQWRIWCHVLTSCKECKNSVISHYIHDCIFYGGLLKWKEKVSMIKPLLLLVTIIGTHSHCIVLVAACCHCIRCQLSSVIKQPL